MWTYILRRLLYNVPVYLGILAVLMGALRVNDPISGKLGKNPSPEDYAALEAQYGLDQPFVVQYATLVSDVLTLDFASVESWTNPGLSVGEMLGASVVPSLSITIPALGLTSVLAVSIAIISAFFRGRPVDKSLMALAVLGMSVSFLVYIIFGQYWLGYLLGSGDRSFFAVGGYEPGIENWAYYCLLPVLISTIVAMGYDTRFYRAVMVEESGRDYITTAKAKGATKRKIMFVHMLKNAMIPIITRIMTTLPFLVMGSLLLEVYFNIPGMGRVLFKAIQEQDFPVVQVFVAMFAALFIVSNILTDVLYALVDPRVRLS